MPNGPFDPQQFELMRAMTTALVAATPKQCAHVVCEMRPKARGPTLELAYKVTCPDRGEEAVPVKEPLDSAAKALVLHMTEGRGRMAGLRIEMRRLPDGNWSSNVKLLEATLATSGPHPTTKPDAPTGSSKPWWKKAG